MPKLFTDKQLREMGGRAKQAPPPVGRIVQVPAKNMPPEAYLKTLQAGARGYGKPAQLAVKELVERFERSKRVGGGYYQKFATVDNIASTLSEIIEEMKDDLASSLDEFDGKYSAWSTITFKKGRPIT